MEAILASDEVKGDPIGSVSTVGVLQQIILAISYLSKVCIPIFVSEIQGHFMLCKQGVLFRDSKKAEFNHFCCFF